MGLGLMLMTSFIDQILSQRPARFTPRTPVEYPYRRRLIAVLISSITARQ